MTVHSLEFTGDGSAHPLSATSKPVKWFTVAAVSSGTVLLGGPEVDSSHGFPATATLPVHFEAISEMTSNYDLAQVYYYTATSATFKVLYAI